MKRDSERMTARTNMTLVKAATIGLIGDGVKSIAHAALQQRVIAQAARHGVYPPVWPAIVDAARAIGCVFHTHDAELPLPAGVRRQTRGAQ